MNPVTTQRRRVRRPDGGRRGGAARCASQPATLFDALPKDAGAEVAAREPAGVTAPAARPARDGVGRDGRAPGSGDRLDRDGHAPGSGETLDRDGRAPGSGETLDRDGRAPGNGETLDRLVVGGWERLTTRATTPCLLCGGTVEPTYGVQARPIGGRCGDCGTTLS